MLLNAIAYVVTLLLFVGIDLVWLTWIGGPVYREVLSDILLPSVRVPPSIAFYLIYPLGLVLFAVLPGVNGGGIAGALWAGALFGFFTYTTYDLTNFATLRNWNLAVTLMDIGWGCVLGAVTAAATVMIVGSLGHVLRLDG